MEFYVYDNYHTFRKRNPHVRNHVNVNDIIITPDGCFWFMTDHDGRDETAEPGTPYLHVHRNMKMRPDMESGTWYHGIDRMEYDPKKKEIAVAVRKWFYRSVPWKKIVIGRYYGSIMPRRITSVKNMIYDTVEHSMHCILSPSLNGKNTNAKTWKEIIEDEQRKNDEESIRISNMYPG